MKYTLNWNVNSIELQANMARAADVPVGEGMNDVAKSTEFFAKFAKDGGANVTAAAIAVCMFNQGKVFASSPSAVIILPIAGLAE